MNIERVQQDLLRLYGSRGSVRNTSSQGGASGAGQTEDAAASRGDDVVLSEGASVVRSAFGVVKNAPDVREGLVGALRDQVQNGTYQYQDQVVARRLLGLAGG